MIRDYALELIWSGGKAMAAAQRGIERNHQIFVAGKPTLEVSADRQFHGDASRHNPEDLLLAALASCHMLAYLYLAARDGLQLRSYRDQVRGRLKVDAAAGRIVEARLQPRVGLVPGQSLEQATALHSEAQRLCFIANSVNFPVHIAAESFIDCF